MTFDIHTIDTALDRYWSGSSSLADEALLRQYFSSTQVAEEHRPYAGLFVHFAEQRIVHTDLQVETVLKSLSTEPQKPSGILRFLTRPRFTMGIAAAMTLMLSVVTLMNMQTNTNTRILDDTADTEEAMRVTKQALAMLGGNINSSSRVVNRNVKKVGSASIIK